MASKQNNKKINIKRKEKKEAFSIRVFLEEPDDIGEEAPYKITFTNAKDYERKMEEDPNYLLKIINKLRESEGYLIESDDDDEFEDPEMRRILAEWGCDSD